MSYQVVNEHHLSDMKPYGHKFIRRDDLTASIRLNIAVTALMAKVNGTWGKISELARQYMISRMFIYVLVYKLETTSLIIFADNRSKPAVIDQELPYYYMLSLRFEG